MVKEREQEALKVEEDPVALVVGTQPSIQEEEQDVLSSSIGRSPKWAKTLRDGTQAPPH